MKNAGPFNEGGNYSCYLILSLVLNTILTGKLFEKKNNIFIISILTTSSTAGYIGLFLFLVIFFYSKNKIGYKILILPAIAFFSLQLYSDIPFLKQKIESQIDSQMSMDKNANVRIGRFHSAIISLSIFKENPIIGKGLYRKDRFISNEEELIGVTGTSFGIIDFAVKYGIIAWIAYFVFLYLSLSLLSIHVGYSKIFGYFSIVPILAIGMAQIPFTHPAFIIIVFIGYYQYLIKKKNNVARNVIS